MGLCVFYLEVFVKKSVRRAGLSVGLVSAVVLPLVGAAPASAGAAGAWNLAAEGQRICMHPDHGWPRTYAFATVEGTWDTPIEYGIRELPPGSSGVGGTLEPGTNERDPDDGGLPVNGWLDLRIAPAPAGEYTAEVWASDGKETQTDSLLLVLREGC